MNERITKIVIDTLGKEGVVNSRAFGHWALSDEEMEKFAELIVRECVNVALDRKEWVENQAVFDPRDRAWNKARVQQSQHIVDKIREHFGVEE